MALNEVHARLPVGNFFLDNQDIQFLFDHIDLKELARIQEDRCRQRRRRTTRPRDADDAVDNYRRILEIVGQVAGDTIAPNAEQVDREGNTLNEDGTVTLHPLVRENLERLAQADLMGFTLPRKYGGLNCPNLIYTMATEIVSRADCSLMNIFGLQGIAETINAFANDEIKDEVLPRFARGEVTGAMVLTEPDAGSDLQAVRLRAYQDEQGNWCLNGVKRFITNGCGEILLVLARSEPEISDGRGLSLFLAERSEKVRVRHLESKLGIHGSPTCELVFEDTPGQADRRAAARADHLRDGPDERGPRGDRRPVAGHRRGGLPPGADLRPHAAAVRRADRAAARPWPRWSPTCRSRSRPPGRWPTRPAASATARTTTCGSSRSGLSRDKDEEKQRKQTSRQLKRLNGMLTPMSKYYCSEMACRVANQAIQVLGGSGYMKDYAAERYMRDARITTIYEGTSQLQVVAAVRGVTSGAFENYVAELREDRVRRPAARRAQAEAGRGQGSGSLEAIQFVKGKSTAYLDLSGRRLVDSAIAVIVGHLLLGQGAADERKKRVARRFIETQLPVLRMNLEQILSGDTSAMDEYELLAGPVPTGMSKAMNDESE